MFPIGDKNIDIIILNKISDEDLKKICILNKYLANLCQKDEFWNSRFHDRFKPYLPFLKNIDYLKYKEGKTWKEYYNELYSLHGEKYPHFLLALAMEKKREDILILLSEIRKIENVDEILEYYPNGEIKKRYYIRGDDMIIKEGKYEEFYPNGNIRFLNYWKSGHPFGKSKVFLENGDVMIETRNVWPPNPTKILDFDEY